MPKGYLALAVTVGYWQAFRLRLERGEILAGLVVGLHIIVEPASCLQIM